MRVTKAYVGTLNARKPLDFTLFRTFYECYIDQNSIFF